MSSLQKKILSMVADDLSDIEKIIYKNLDPYLDIVKQTAEHIFLSGGKRLRPLLVTLCARLCGDDKGLGKRFSAIFEYLHTATLLHDDLVDGATQRRGRDVANTIWGNSTAVLVGDFLLAKSLEIAAEAEDIEIIKVVAHITREMAEGEIFQLLKRGDKNLSLDEYMMIIKGKTGVLIEGSCRTGALIAKADRKQEKALTEYGFNMGMAFQMADDLLDYTSDTASIGKETGADLREGKLTLPVIIARKNAKESDLLFIDKIIEKREFSLKEFEKFVSLLEKYQGIKYTKRCILNHIDKAKKTLDIFENSRPKETLMLIADYVFERKY